MSSQGHNTATRIFKEDKVFYLTVNLPYGPPMNTENDYYFFAHRP